MKKKKEEANRKARKWPHFQSQEKFPALLKKKNRIYIRV
jgi:hypothetical protein